MQYHDSFKSVSPIPILNGESINNTRWMVNYVNMRHIKKVGLVEYHTGL